jgi:uncharacterized protein (TIGR00730 family)
MTEKNKNKKKEDVKRDVTHPLHEVEDYRDTLRIFRIMAELVEGYNFLAKMENEITILGSARFHEDHRYYIIAREFGKLLAKNGFTTLTGGGGGIMEAGNRGAHEAGGESVGLNIQLPFEQRVNPYVMKSAAFHYFFTRKVMLTSPANGFAFFPGGFGTMDEFFEVVDNIDLGMMGRVPLVLVGREYWEPLIRFMKDSCGSLGTVDTALFDTWPIVDTAEEAYAVLDSLKGVGEVCDPSYINNFHCGDKIDWKIFRVMAELVEGFDFINGIEHAVTILGTKSIPTDSPYYDAAYRLGEFAAMEGYSVVTGGKGGTAEAANKGAYEHGGESIGVGMNVVEGEKVELNSYLTRSIIFDFPFTRKLIVTAPTDAFIVFPGGLGTMHQLFEILTLIQTGKMRKRPVILYDRSFWGGLDVYIRDIFITKLKTIAQGDDMLYTMVDDVSEIMPIIKSHHMEPLSKYE